MIQITCDACGKYFKKYACHTLRTKHHFCTKKCHDLFQRKPVVKKCEICRDEFVVRPCDSHKYVTCAKSLCRSIKKSKERNPNWRGGKGKIKRGIDARYKKWRKEIVERDGATCQQCGSKDKKIEVHHLMPWKFHEERRYDIENGVTLCVDCHRMYLRRNPQGMIACDFDGTLMTEGDMPMPIDSMINRVRGWIGDGKQVVIFTANGLDATSFKRVQVALHEFGLKGLMVTPFKLRDYIEIWDDRAVTVERNTGKIIGGFNVLAKVCGKKS